MRDCLLDHLNAILNKGFGQKKVRLKEHDQANDHCDQADNHLLGLLKRRDLSVGEYGELCRLGKSRGRRSLRLETPVYEIESLVQDAEKHKIDSSALRRLLTLRSGFSEQLSDIDQFDEDLHDVSGQLMEALGRKEKIEGGAPVRRLKAIPDSFVDEVVARMVEELVSSFAEFTNGEIDPPYALAALVRYRLGRSSSIRLAADGRKPEIRRAAVALMAADNSLSDRNRSKTAVTHTTVGKWRREEPSTAPVNKATPKRSEKSPKKRT